MSKTLPQATIDLLSRMSKLVDQGFTPEEAKEYMIKKEPEWRDSKGYGFSKSGMRASVKRLHRKLEWQKSGASIIIDNKPQ